jgi:hypothetical protein
MKLLGLIALGPAAIIVAVVIAGVLLLLPAAILMLLLGALHSTYAVVPALGFWTTWQALWALHIVGAAFHETSSNSTKN